MHVSPFLKMDICGNTRRICCVNLTGTGLRRGRLSAQFQLYRRAALDRYLPVAVRVLYTGITLAYANVGVGAGRNAPSQGCHGRWVLGAQDVGIVLVLE